MLKAIYFDYHGVLDRHTFRGLLETMGQTWLRTRNQDDQQYLNAFIQREQEPGHHYTAGKTVPAAYWHRIAQEYGQEVEKIGRQYLLHVQPIRETWNLVSLLHEKFDVGLFSDCPLDKKEAIRSAYALTEFFDYLVFSCDVQLSKRSPEFFNLLLQNGLFKSEECLIIDNSEANIKFAQKLGFQAHVYTTPEELQTFIETLHA